MTIFELKKLVIITFSIVIILLNSKQIQAPGVCSQDAVGTLSVIMDVNPTTPVNTETSNLFTCTLNTITSLGQCTLTFQYQQATGITWNTATTNYTAVANARSQPKTTDSASVFADSGVPYDLNFLCGQRQSKASNVLSVRCAGTGTVISAPFNVTCNDVVLPSTRNFKQLNFTNNNNNTMIVDCQAQDNTNINDIQIWTNISATTNKMNVNQTQNYYGTGNSLVYNTTKTFTLNNVPNGIYKYGCFVNDTANNNATTINYTYTINAPSDSTLPNYIIGSILKNASTIVQNQLVNFSANWTDNIKLSSWIFSINQTGLYVNSTAYSFNELNGNVSTNITLITAIAGTNVSWRFWANDSSNLWNLTGSDSFIVSSNPVVATIQSIIKFIYDNDSLPHIEDREFGYDNPNLHHTNNLDFLYNNINIPHINKTSVNYP